MIASPLLAIAAHKGTPARSSSGSTGRSTRCSQIQRSTSGCFELGSIPKPGSIADFAKLVADDTEKWGKVVKFAGLKAD